MAKKGGKGAAKELLRCFGTVLDTVEEQRTLVSTPLEDPLKVTKQVNIVIITTLYNLAISDNSTNPNVRNKRTIRWSSSIPTPWRMKSPSLWSAQSTLTPPTVLIRKLSLLTSVISPSFVVLIVDIQSMIPLFYEGAEAMETLAESLSKHVKAMMSVMRLLLGTAGATQTDLIVKALTNLLTGTLINSTENSKIRNSTEAGIEVILII
jgi:hypothetical protein